MKNTIKKILSLSLIFSLFSFVYTTRANVSDIIVYSGKLLNDQNAPIVGSYKFRFSLWKDADFLSSDLDENGNINTNSNNYSNWIEEHTLEIKQDGSFYVDLGIVNKIPSTITNSQKFLQVEIKEVNDANTEYQLMDVNGENGLDEIDRKSILVPAAVEAEKSYSSVSSKFVIDPDDEAYKNGAGDIFLNFGNETDKKLGFNIENSLFNFNDKLKIMNNLIIDNDNSGSVNIDTQNLNNKINVTFNDEDTVIVGENNTQTLKNKTIDGNENNIINIDRSILQEKDAFVLLTPSFRNLDINQDGSSNMVSLHQGDDNGKKYYVLSSKENNLQDLDLDIIIPKPSNYSSLKDNTLEFDIKTTSSNATKNKIDIFITNSDGNNFQISNNIGLISTNTWSKHTIKLNEEIGEYITVKVKMYSTKDNKVFLSNIKFNYNSK